MVNSVNASALTLLASAGSDLADQFAQRQHPHVGAAHWASLAGRGADPLDAGLQAIVDEVALQRGVGADEVVDLRRGQRGHDAIEVPYGGLRRARQIALGHQRGLMGQLF